MRLFQVFPHGRREQSRVLLLATQLRQTDDRQRQMHAWQKQLPRRQVLCQAQRGLPSLLW